MLLMERTLAPDWAYSTDAARGVPPQARLREDAGARARPAGPRRGARAGPSSVRRPEAPRDAPALRLPAGDRRRARLVGRPEGPDPRFEDPADGGPRRGPPDGVLRLRGRDPGQAVRRGRRDRVGLGHVGARGGDARPGRGRRQRRAQVRAVGREGEGPLHDRPNEPPARHGPADGVRGRRGRAVAAASTRRVPTTCRAGTRRTTRRASSRAARTTRSRPTPRRSGSPRRPRRPPRSTCRPPATRRCRATSSR